MSKHKRQHFVPQFYLRHFSPTQNKRVVDVYNLQSHRLIRNAPLKKQAFRNYFYGKDLTFEKMLGDQEREAARIIRDVIGQDCLPQRGSNDYVSLLMFVLFLKSRTERSANETREMWRMQLESYSSKFPHLKADLQGLQQDQFLYTLQSIAATASVAIFAGDLDYVLVKNQSRIEFLTSDNPVHFDNRYMERKRAYGSQTGLACKGLRVFFPLSPIHLIVFYDPDIYICSGEHEGLILVDREYDLWGINRLQFISAHKNVFCTDTYTQSELDHYRSQSQKMREEYRQIALEHVLASAPDQSVFEFGHRDPKAGLDLSFIRIRKRAMNSPISGAAAEVRDRVLCTLFQKFQELVEAGTYREGQFYEFLSTHIPPDSGETRQGEREDS